MTGIEVVDKAERYDSRELDPELKELVTVAQVRPGGHGW